MKNKMFDHLYGLYMDYDNIFKKILGISATTRVKNSKNTSNLKPAEGYDSHLDQWEDEKKRIAKECSNTECHNQKDLVGGHVEDQYQNEYLTPLCKDCNNVNNKDYFNVETKDLLKIKDSDSWNDNF